MSDKKRMWIWVGGENGENLGGVGGGATVIEIYCIKNLLKIKRFGPDLLSFLLL